MRHFGVSRRTFHGEIPRAQAVSRREGFSIGLVHPTSLKFSHLEHKLAPAHAPTKAPLMRVLSADARSSPWSPLQTIFCVNNNHIRDMAVEKPPPRAPHRRRCTADSP